MYLTVVERGNGKFTDYEGNLFKQLIPEVTMGLITCFGCRKMFDDSFSFCPHCGRKKGAPIEEMRLIDTEKITESVQNNIKTYRKEMEDMSEILGIFKEKDRTTFEMQKRITEKILHRFPEIERIMKEDQHIEFQAFIINVPYTQNGDYLHHCMLQELAKGNENIANFSLGVQELASDLFEVNIPIWINEPFEEETLKKQFEEFRKAIPWEQKKFIYAAEPWYFINRVHDFDGRWINWKVLFKISEGEFKEFTEKYREIPLSIHMFSNLAHANHFSTVGTALDGESFLGIVEDKEIPEFTKIFQNLESLFPEDRKPTLEMIRINWDLLKDLGFLGFSLDRILSGEFHIFSKNISQNLMEIARDEAAQFTQQEVLRQKQGKDEILDALTDELINKASKKQKGVTSEIVRPISRELRNEYRITGDAK